MLVKRVLFALVSLSLVLFSSCNQGVGSVNVELSSPHKTLAELSTVSYDSVQLSEIINFVGTLNQLNDQYPIECVRATEHGYRVSYLGAQSVGIVLFNSTGAKLSGNTYKLSPEREIFEKLQTGDSLERVLETDPDGDYMFLYTGRNDTPKISTHYTRDGYLCSIEYDESLQITDVLFELI